MVARVFLIIVDLEQARRALTERSAAASKVERGGRHGCCERYAALSHSTATCGRIRRKQSIASWVERRMRAMRRDGKHRQRYFDWIKRRSGGTLVTRGGAARSERAMSGQRALLKHAKSEDISTTYLFQTIACRACPNNPAAARYFTHLWLFRRFSQTLRKICCFFCVSRLCFPSNLAEQTRTQYTTSTTPSAI